MVSCGHLTELTRLMDLFSHETKYEGCSESFRLRLHFNCQQNDKLHVTFVQLGIHIQKLTEI